MLCVLSHSIVSDSLQPQGPARFLCPWGFSRQEYWSGLPCPPAGDLPNPGFEPRSLAWQADFFTTKATREALFTNSFFIFPICMAFFSSPSFSLTPVKKHKSLIPRSWIFFFFYFILLYNTVLVLPYIDMNPPWVYINLFVLIGG